MSKEYYGVGGCAMCGFPVYVAPPQRTWVGLTDEDKASCVQATAKRGSTYELIAAIEAKLKEKNT
jgi:hypothetical protein